MSIIASSNLIKCSRCSFRAPQNAFPRRGVSQYLKTCTPCTEKNNKASKKRRNQESDDESDDDPDTKRRRLLGKDTSTQGPPTMPWQSVVALLEENHNSAFELHAYAELDNGSDLSGLDLANKLSKDVWTATGYRFIYKKKRISKTNASATVYTYFCAQIKGEETKKRLTEDKSKRRARMCMERFDCDGWLHITVDTDDLTTICICIAHYKCHTPYTSISIPDDVKKLIEEMKDLPATKIWDALLSKTGKTELTEKQIYARWVRLNEDRWRLDNDQVTSARKVLQSFEGVEVDIINIPQEQGISCIAFAFREVLSEFGSEITEIAMDSTWKTNAAGYELYGVVGEANGQALVLAFAFTASIDGTAEEGAKDRMMQRVLEHVRGYCPGIQFAHTDKDKTEINAIHRALPRARSQLCYWHAIRYLKERLAEDKVPAKYDPRKAHKIFDFIDPTWAPGIDGIICTQSFEEGVHTDDLDNDDVPTTTQPPPLTCLPPILVLVADGQKIPVWPAPPIAKRANLPEFCPKDHREPIIEKFRIHFHQHPEIPMNDAQFSRLTAEQIHHGAVLDMYTYCRDNGLSQAWAYLWNRWYTPNQWRLWARATVEAISRLKTTMIVESLWKNVKHRDLKDFNRPRLDVVTHIVLTSVLPRVKLVLANVLGSRRAGRPMPLAGWQKDMREEWLGLSRCDEHRLVAKELEWRKKPRNTKGREERLAEIEQDYARPRGKYLTDVERWVCSCPAYLISRFLLCKHLVRKANEILNDLPLDSLEFFLKLRRQYYVPYYTIEGIHIEVPTEEEPIVNINIRVLGRLNETRTEMQPTQPLAAPAPNPILHHGPVGETEETEDKEDDWEDYDNSLEFDDESPDREIIPDAETHEIEMCYQHAIKALKRPGGVHPKLAKVLREAFKPVKKVGGDIGRHLNRRRSQRTWKDSNKNTLYLD
ncbi:hypothetical protein DXG01_008775 [Tephrocybe rancida]|nr:hypothetical protein DXG01_008775 [Tephrocybe rancida]